MEREQEWQEQGGGEQSDEGGPAGVPPDVDGPDEDAPGDEGEPPTEAA